MRRSAFQGAASFSVAFRVQRDAQRASTSLANDSDTDAPRSPHVRPDPTPKTYPEQTEIASGTPPARTPETLPDNTDLQPDQNPVRGTPDISKPGADG